MSAAKNDAAPLANLEEWEDFLKERYPETPAAVGPDSSKTKEQFRDYENTARPTVREFYRLNHRHQSFDFVHQRLLRSGIPVVAWPDAIAELVRVTRPGGWIELFEIGNEQMREGPATSELFGCLLRLATTRGLDTDGSVVFALDRLLTEAGLEDVTARRIELPLGEWGGRPGSFLASDLRAMFTRLAPAFQARLSIPQERTLELIPTALWECEQLHSCAVFLGAWGRRRE